MIPKIIHYCWISGDPFPPLIQKCIDSWNRVLPDYVFVLWDKKRAESIGAKYVNEAIANKRYASASDFIRFYALYTYGGIYLDADVEVLRPFDELLKIRYFIGKENSGNDWEPAIIGAEPGIPWMRNVLKYWNFGKISFIDMWGRPRNAVLPQVCGKQLKQYTIHDCNAIEEWLFSDEWICRFPPDWFTPKSWETLDINITTNTYCIHHFTASWHQSHNNAFKLTPIQKLLKSVRSIASYIIHDVVLRKRT